MNIIMNMRVGIVLDEYKMLEGSEEITIDRFNSETVALGDVEIFIEDEEGNVISKISKEESKEIFENLIRKA